MGSILHASCTLQHKCQMSGVFPSSLELSSYYVTFGLYFVRLQRGLLGTILKRTVDHFFCLSNSTMMELLITISNSCFSLRPVANLEVMQHWHHMLAITRDPQHHWYSIWWCRRTFIRLHRVSNQVFWHNLYINNQIWWLHFPRFKFFIYHLNEQPSQTLRSGATIAEQEHSKTAHAKQTQTHNLAGNQVPERMDCAVQG